MFILGLKACMNFILIPKLMKLPDQEVVEVGGKEPDFVTCYFI